MTTVDEQQAALFADLNADPGAANKNEPPRDQHGRYLLPDLRGGKTSGRTRATTIAKALDDGYHLSLWAQRQAVFGLSRRRDLLALVDACPDPSTPDGKATLNDVVERAKDTVQSGGGASYGTALHAFTERMVTEGGAALSTIPAEYHGDLLAYREKLTEYGFREFPRMLERTVFNCGVNSAGTFDRIIMMPDGTLAIADLKTQKTMEFGGLAVAIQLAIYANADAIYDFETGRYEPMPNVSKDKAYVLHLPVGQKTCTVYEIDIRIGWVAALEAVRVRELRSIKTLVQPYAPGVRPGAGLPGSGHPQKDPTVQMGDPFASLNTPAAAEIPLAGLAADMRAANPSLGAPVSDAAVAAASNGHAVTEAALALPASGVQPQHGVLCTMSDGRCVSPHCPRCGSVADAQGGHACSAAPGGHPAWSSAQQKIIQINPDGTAVGEIRRPATALDRAQNDTPSFVAHVEQVAAGRKVTWDHEMSLTTMTKAQVQEIARQHGIGDLKRYKAKLIPDILAARAAGVLPELDGATTEDQHDAAVQAATDAPEAPEVGGAGVPMEPVTPPAQPLQQANPFANTPAVAEAPPEDFAASMAAAGSFAELAAVWDRAGVAGQTAELMAAGTARKDELVRAGITG